MAPGLLRPKMGFERWASFSKQEASVMAEMRAQAKAAVREASAPIMAMDIDPQAVELTLANAKLAGVKLAHAVQPLDKLALGTDLD